jgi:hypothetical protein
MGYSMVSSKYIRKKSFLLFLVINLSFFSFLLPEITTVQAVSFAYADYWFYVDSPQTIAYDEMFFTINNFEDYPILINCSYEQLEGVNISVKLSWSYIELEADTTIKNHYTIDIGESFNTTYDLKIYCQARVSNITSGNPLLTGAIILNRLSYFSESQGYRLELNALDQGNRPRESRMQLFHKTNDSYAYTPIKEYFGNKLIGYFPKGHYLVIATDNKTGIIGEEQFFLDNNSIIDIYLDLILFSRFTPVAYGNNQLAMNTTVDCYIDSVFDVSIYAELYFDGEKLDTTDSKDVIIPELRKGMNYPFLLKFNYDNWKVGEYEVFGYIYSASQKMVEKFKVIQLSDVAIKNKQPDYLVFVLSLMFFLGIGSAFVFMRYNNKRKWEKLEETYNK